MTLQRNYRVIITGRGRMGIKANLRGPNLIPNLPPRFTQLSWLFGSHGGLLAYQRVITGNKYNQ